MIIEALSFKDGEGARFRITSATSAERVLLDACVAPEDKYERGHHSFLSRGDAVNVFILTMPVFNGEI